MRHRCHSMRSARNSCSWGSNRAFNKSIAVRPPATLNEGHAKRLQLTYSYLDTDTVTSVLELFCSSPVHYTTPNLPLHSCIIWQKQFNKRRPFHLHNHTKYKQEAALTCPWFVSGHAKWIDEKQVISASHRYLSLPESSSLSAHPSSGRWSEWLRHASSRERNVLTERWCNGDGKSHFPKLFPLLDQCEWHSRNLII